MSESGGLIRERLVIRSQARASGTYVRFNSQVNTICHYYGITLGASVASEICLAGALRLRRRLFRIEAAVAVDLLGVPMIRG